MNDTSQGDAGRQEPERSNDKNRDQDDRAAHDVLSAIDAEHVIDEPGDPEAADPGSPASDADAPAPPG
jgi:hypothetical protein